MHVLDRFLKYVSFDTGSDAASPTIPSTEKQKSLGQFLVSEMLQMGISRIWMSRAMSTGASLQARKNPRLKLA